MGLRQNRKLRSYSILLCCAGASVYFLQLFCFPQLAADADSESLDIPLSPRTPKAINNTLTDEYEQERLWKGLGTPFQNSDEDHRQHGQWMSRISCSHANSCEIHNLFYMNASFHAFYVNEDVDSELEGVSSNADSSTRVPVQLGLSDEVEFIWVHRNIRPTASIMNNAARFNESSFIVSTDSIRDGDLAGAFDLLAALAYVTTNAKLFLTTSTVQQPLLRELLKPEGSFESMRSLSGISTSEILVFSHTFIGLDTQFLENFESSKWTLDISHVYSESVERIRASVGTASKMNTDATNICLFDDPSADFKHLQSFLSKSGVRASVLDENVTDLKTAATQFANCHTFICSQPDCNGYHYLAPSATFIVSPKGKDEESKSSLAQKLQLSGSFPLWWSGNLSSTADCEKLKELITLQGNVQVEKSRFLTFMPWEQLNNQLLGLKSTCAIAKLLNRTLILPMIGQRKTDLNVTQDWNFSFNIMDYSWQPIGHYFDQQMLDTTMPCATISWENFQTLKRMRRKSTGKNLEIGHAVFNPVASATSVTQMNEYYRGILGFDMETANTSYPRLSQLTQSQVLDYWGTESSEILAFGSAFWMYGFGRTQPYPLTRYENYMDDLAYSEIVSAMRLSSRLNEVAGEALWRLKAESERKVLAVHVRRGDYWNKCKRINDPILREKCYPSDAAILSLIQEKLRLLESADTTREKPAVYIATNLGGFRKNIEALKTRYTVLYFEDVVQAEGANIELDSIDAALLDIELCSHADMFIGNFYSSFSRAILEKRQLAGLGFTTY
ncbi:GDP-fucose protein O-fucosyltransferase-domain-containing protein [Chytriomyces cf. hyalinus JEL632]|nr:GDP-fucose protein O-fucosyltransferase-domain-containing protein [Chytriomyces cf. hyalinus JEL632]